eukprot:CAMPEP_0172449894 /NCGR_PEP_ID=MMETSP1065-20121228/8470_1 /TAXON_ID=265537 /ORGANISM="Amphiprora paludosa, Strain CCMP125" /LENGTH=678 /DNA_ID=CAMNT_0013201651 /DNA_START=52 /DNA_END=2088 /DNA_ORIENTATION=-
MATPPSQGGGVISPHDLLSSPTQAQQLLVSSTSNSSPCGMSNYLEIPTDESQRQLNERSSMNSMGIAKTCDIRDEARTMDATSFNVLIWILNCIWSFVQEVRSVYLPLLSQSLSGGLDLIKYVLLGQLLENNPALRNLLSPLTVIFSVEQGKVPPPGVTSALTCLALLTCVALAVHPDGFTWTALRRIREFLMSMLNSSTTCWAWLLNDDTGIISTMLALATFCALFFFCYVLHRTLAPKQPRLQRTNISSETESPPPLAPLANGGPHLAKSNAPTSSSKKRKKKKSAAKRKQAYAVVAPLDESSVQLQNAAVRKLETFEQSASRKAEADDNMDSGFSSATRPYHSREKSLQGTHSTTRTEFSDHVPKSSALSEKAPRSRVESASTVDTAASSVFLDEEVSSARTAPSHQYNSKQQRNHARSKQRGGKRQGQNQSELVVSSRWDALKPETASSRSQTQPRKTQVKNANANQPRGNNSRGNGSSHHAQRSNAIPKPNPVVPVVNSSLSPALSTPVRNPRASPSVEKRQNINYLGQQQSTPLQSETSSFFSELNPQTPPFAPSSPSPKIRPPPGLSLSPGKNEKTRDDNAFFLPPTYRHSFNPDLAFGCPSAASRSSPPPGLMVPTGAAVAPGVDVRCPPSFQHSPSMLKENPFEEQENDAQIEAELQELGGRMIENLLD